MKCILFFVNQKLKLHNNNEKYKFYIVLNALRIHNIKIIINIGNKTVNCKAIVMLDKYKL